MLLIQCKIFTIKSSCILFNSTYFYQCVIFCLYCFRVLSISAVLGSALTILHECIPKICEVLELTIRSTNVVF